MQPPIPLPDPHNPPFAAVNDARTEGFYPFDPLKLRWTADAAPEAREAALAKFRLGLQYTIKEATSLFAPCRGEVRWGVAPNAGDPTTRPLILRLDDPGVINRLRFGGRAEDRAEPAKVSRFPRTSLAGAALQARLLFTFEGPDLYQRLRAQLVSLHEAGHLERKYDPNADLQWLDGDPIPVKLPGATREQHLELWWNGESAAQWRLIGADVQNKLVDLHPNDVVLIQAQLRDGLDPTDHWYLCNVGLIFRSLGLLGDPADEDSDKAYLALCGGPSDPDQSSEAAFAPVMSGGTPWSRGTNPAGSKKLSFKDIVVVHGGSQGGVLLQPPPDSLVPGCVFSFTSAEDIYVFSPRFSSPLGQGEGEAASQEVVDQPLGVRLWQPTYDRLQLSKVQDKVVAAGGKRSEVYVPSADQVLLTTEYGYPDRGMPYPNIARNKFLTAMEAEYGHDGSRARPAATQDPHPLLPPLGGWERSLNLNELAEVRPTHPRWRVKKKGEEYAIVRRLFPLWVEMRLGTTNDSPKLCTISQDEIDCVRQEYIFHMAFTDYYQNYPARVRVFRSPSHRLDRDGGKKLPALGARRQITVPDRSDIRPITAAEKRPTHIKGRCIGRGRITQGSLSRYRNHTLLTDQWESLLDEVTQRSRAYAAYLSALVGAIEADPQGPIPPASASLARADVLVQVTRRLVALTNLALPPPPDTVEGFLYRVLTTTGTDPDWISKHGATAIDRFRSLWPLDLWISSSWRPPEHNESVSSTPASNHQLGEAMDVQPRCTKRRRRNPLSLLCLHLAAEEFYPAKLHEMLLENGSHEYLVGSLEPDSFDHFIIEDVPGRKYSQKKTDIYIEELQHYIFDDDSTPVTERTKLDRRLAQEFRKQYENVNHPGAPWPSQPSPTYLDLYVFALVHGSHVHFTWKL